MNIERKVKDTAVYAEEAKNSLKLALLIGFRFVYIL
jgi:hypothetical protein